MLISIIIVNYNVTSELDNCINSILQYTKDIECEILVVDNNSQDRSVELLQQKYPEVKFFFLYNNIGFSRANNFAAEKSKAEYLLILNPDTIFIEDFINPIINYIETHSNTGACGPMLLYKDLSYQNSAGSRMGLFYETAEALFYINHYRKFKKFLNSKRYKRTHPFKVGWMSGACILLKRALYNEIGGFNSEYFLNYEDLDFCNRVENKGYVNLYFPHLKCIHLDQTSQKRDYEAFVYSRYVSRLIYDKYHYNFLKRFWVRLIHIIGIILRLIFVNFIYSNQEKIQRRRGYYKSLILYFGINK